MEILHPTAIQKIDEALHLVATASDFNQNIQFNDILKKINRVHDNVASIELTQIVRHLEKENFIEDLQQGGRVYIATFEGMLFYQQGGYHKRLETQTILEKRLKNVEKKSLFNTITITILTALITIGTCIQAWYYLLEIFS
jgi:hypothetical protein